MTKYSTHVLCLKPLPSAWREKTAGVPRASTGMQRSRANWPELVMRAGARERVTQETLRRYEVCKLKLGVRVGARGRVTQEKLRRCGVCKLNRGVNLVFFELSVTFCFNLFFLPSSNNKCLCHLGSLSIVTCFVLSVGSNDRPGYRKFEE